MKKFFSVIVLGALFSAVSHGQPQLNPAAFGQKFLRAATAGEAISLLGINTNQVAITNISSFGLEDELEPPVEFLFYSNAVPSRRVMWSNMLASINAQKKIFSVKDFGAKGDGVCVNRGFTTNGSTTFFCGSANFTGADIGKVISIYGASTNNQNLTTTIVGVLSANRVTLATPALANTTNLPAVYGTDDTPSIQAALNFVVSNAWGGTIFFPVERGSRFSIYIVNGVLKDATGSWTNHHYAQLYIPPVTPEYFSPTVSFEGPYPASSGGAISRLETDIDTVGAVIWSTYPRAPDAQFCRVLDARNFVNPGTAALSPCHYKTTGYYVPINNIRFRTKFVTFRTAWDNNMATLDLSGAMACQIEDTWVDTGFRPTGVAAWPHTGTNSFGILFPSSFNENVCQFERSEVRGFYNGIDVTASVVGQNNNIQACYNAVTGFGQGGNPNVLTHLHVSFCKNIFRGGTCFILNRITDISVEQSLFGWWDNPVLFNDPNFNMAGQYSYTYGGLTPLSMGTYQPAKTRITQLPRVGDQVLRELTPVLLSNRLVGLELFLTANGNFSKNPKIAWVNTTNFSLGLTGAGDFELYLSELGDWTLANTIRGVNELIVKTNGQWTFSGSSYGFGPGTITHSGIILGNGWSANAGVLGVNTSVGTGSVPVPSIFTSNVVFAVRSVAPLVSELPAGGGVIWNSNSARFFYTLSSNGVAVTRPF